MVGWNAGELSDLSGDTSALPQGRCSRNTGVRGIKIGVMVNVSGESANAVRSTNRVRRPASSFAAVAVCVLFLGLFVAAVLGYHSKREAVERASAMTCGRLGGTWENFEAEHGSMDDGRILGVDCRRTKHGYYVYVEGVYPKMLVIDLGDPFGRSNTGVPTEIVRALVDDFLPGDSVLVAEKTWTPKIGKNGRTHFLCFRANSLGLLHPSTDWRGQRPGSVVLRLRESERGDPTHIIQAILEFRLADGRYPSTTGRLKSTGHPFGPSMFEDWPYLRTPHEEKPPASEGH